MSKDDSRIMLQWPSKKYAPWNKELRRTVSQIYDMGLFKKFAFENVTIAAQQKWKKTTTPGLKPLALEHLYLLILASVFVYFLVALPIFIGELCIAN